jgi:hypothetical protein
LEKLPINYRLSFFGSFGENLAVLKTNRPSHKIMTQRKQRCCDLFSINQV